MGFCLGWAFSFCEVDTYPLGIKLENSHFYANYQRMVSYFIHALPKLIGLICLPYELLWCVFLLRVIHLELELDWKIPETFTCFLSGLLIAVQKDSTCASIFKTILWKQRPICALVASLKGLTSTLRFVLAAQSADETYMTRGSLKRWKVRGKALHYRENSFGNIHFRADCFVEVFRLLNKRKKDFRYLSMISDFANSVCCSSCLAYQACARLGIVDGILNAQWMIPNGEKKVNKLSDFSRNLIMPELHHNGLDCVAVKSRNFVCTVKSKQHLNSIFSPFY